MIMSISLSVVVTFLPLVSSFLVPYQNALISIPSQAVLSMPSSRTVTVCSSQISDTVNNPTKPSTSIGNNEDPDYPYSFSGRLWFRPAFVRIPTKDNGKPSPPPSISILSMFGWTIGGVVALEYDDSPVGPYREYVSMGAVVLSKKRGALGQWGSRLYVSTAEAEAVCQEVWNVPAELADIEFVEDTKSFPLCVTSAPDPTTSKSKGVPRIAVTGWANTRILRDDDDARRGGLRLPVLWTPSIKALWAPFVPFSSNESDNKGDKLPLHNLRLSASAIRLCFGCGQETSESLGVPLPFGLMVDNVLIEIGPQSDSF